MKKRAKDKKKKRTNRPGGFGLPCHVPYAPAALKEGV
jgi:hypothetical protein